MKKKILFVQAILIAFVMISGTVWAGDEENFNSNFKISPDMSFEPTADFQKCWEVVYGESENPVHVFMKETKKGNEYLVRTKYFEVKYVNGVNGFGARLLNSSESTVTESLNMAVINSSALKNQKCISPDAIDNAEVIKMIASYLPDIVNEQYRNVLN